MLPAICTLALRASSSVEVRIAGGRFSAKEIHLGSAEILRFRNADRAAYTVESPGLLPGDVTVPAGGYVDVKPLYEAGKFTAMIEEVPTSEIAILFDGRPFDDPSQRESPFDWARRYDRQPLLFAPGQEPAYGAYTTFNLSVRGEAARQRVLQDLFRLQEELSCKTPPKELAPYLSASAWANLRPTVALVIGLGTSAYDSSRFGARVASSKPRALHDFKLADRTTRKSGQDLLLRVVSDSQWFNLRVCRLAWSRLQGRICDPTLQSGYAPPQGRSPILGGFFDGIGNPSGADRERAVYGPNGARSTYLALLRIRFDEEKFTRLSLTQQESIVGRRRTSGHLTPSGPETAHRKRAQNDGKSLIVRLPLIFDDGPGDTGLLFGSLQFSIDRQFERILNQFMLPPGKNGRPDGLLAFMKFEEGAYYYVPSSTRGSYPGSLRGF